jgi:putative DNA primase/helicase
VFGDLDARAVKHTDTFKVLTGGDSGGDYLRAERKYGAGFSFVPYVLPLFSANEAPISSDQSQAWFDRWLVIPMTRRIPEDAVDPHLSEMLTTPAELEGLLVQSIRGLRRLMRRRRFALPASVRGALTAYRDRLDSVHGFVADLCEFGPEHSEQRGTVYIHYKEWCEANNRFALSNQNFYDRFRGDAYPVEEHKVKGHWYLKGIRSRSFKADKF